MKNDRQERGKVLKLAQARKIDAILVTELTRFSRSTTDLIDNLQDLYARGVPSVPPNSHFYRYLLTTREDMEFGTMAMREAWKEVGTSLGLNKYQIAQIAGDNVPILHDIEAVDRRRIWMQAIEDRILELATACSAETVPAA